MKSCGVRPVRTTSRLATCLTVLLVALPTAAAAPAANTIENPTFADADGDGKPDGWEMETFILEKFRGTNCLSMKMPRKDKSAFTGKVTTGFKGPEGFYRVTVEYLDEKDGVSKGKLLVNGDVRHIWNFDGTFGDCWRQEVVENVELKPGDTITFWGRDNPTEYCRVRKLSVEPSPQSPTGAALEELRTKPVIGEAASGPLVPLAAHRDLSAEESRPESRPLILGGPILFLAAPDRPVAFELTLNQPRTPTWSFGFHGAGATGRGKPKTVVKDAALPYDPATSVATIRPVPEKEGLHELRAPQGYWSSETPHVLAVEGKAGDSITGAGNGVFYFFVPAGTKAFGIGGYCNGGYIAEVTVRAPDGRLAVRMDVPNDAAEGIPVRVRPGEDDAVWSVGLTGVSPKIRLVGVPPFVATHPRHLLVPEPCLGSAKKPDPHNKAANKRDK
jgi:hypothetical protein